MVDSKKLVAGNVVRVDGWDDEKGVISKFGIIVRGSEHSEFEGTLWVAFAPQVAWWGRAQVNTSVNPETGAPWFSVSMSRVQEVIEL